MILSLITSGVESMNISLADSKHIDYICHTLSQHFSTINSHFGFVKYKDDIEIMHKHVTKRVNGEVEDFIYFVAENEDTYPVGFISLLIDEQNVGSILLVRGENKEIIKSLIDKSVEYFKEKDVAAIQGEFATFEEDTIEVLKSMGIEEKLVNYSLNL